MDVRREDEIVKSYLTNIELVMLTVKFKVNDSPNNKETVELAMNILKAQVIKGTCWIMVRDNKLFENIAPIKGLCDRIQNWKSTVAFFHGKRISLYRFVHELTPIKECSQNFEEHHHLKNCWESHIKEGWGCKFLISVKNSIPEKISDSNKYWYNFGHFKNDDWIIDKEQIKERLLHEANNKGLSLCPYFNFDSVLQKINNFPDKIVVDNVNYRLQYREDFVHDKIMKVPFNIQHIPKNLPVEHGTFKIDRFRFSEN